MRLGVIGLGNMGSNHVKVCCKVKNASLVGCCDIDREKVDRVSKEYNLKGFYDYKDMVEEVDAVIVATQTVYHYDVAKFFIENGKDVLIEKPITLKYEDGKELIRLAKEKDVKLAVGHVERFNPAVEALVGIFKEEEAIGISVKRMSPMDNRVQDIDVILDLMIHDIDVVLSLMGDKNIKNIEAMGRIIKKESMLNNSCDHATALIKFNNNIIVDITASRVSEKKVRTLSLNSTDSYYELDYIDKSLTIYRQLKSNIDNNIRCANRYSKEEVFINFGESLLKQNQNFVDAIVSNVPLKVKGEDGLLALEVANKIRKKIYENL
ncbi:Gfo/Idh/MocA family protein [Clostridium senegalense]|uniref:Gfo/Idh/MocA family oxidoreductase n=1 Tax=Clostridium senegalense TaxID=1465809 RepID=A0A6M0H6E5_9CLOT|nr:Gfo/Idh/MocA family oxidoreductase [Clostridium senegalense]NEU05854.1 Gfo/Idh/MocA family oxidoreductase [Clostridium senegalense]